MDVTVWDLQSHPNILNNFQLASSNSPRALYLISPLIEEKTTKQC